MRTLLTADFNARTLDDRVRLNTVGSLRDLEKNPLPQGSWVWLSDGEVRVQACLEDSPEGLVARVAWDTVEDIPLTFFRND